MTHSERCPICGGNGLVQGGFYNQVGGTWTTGSTAFETCRSCGGSGYIVVHDSEYNTYLSKPLKVDIK